ncbi:MAG: TrkH family potassium uptake protein [Candidatus Methanomethylophilaceae archaeon]|jgi:trk system potassium uptake protein TrkH
MFSAENFLNTYRKPIWKNTSVSILSVIMVLLGLSFLAPLALSIYYGDNPWMFLYPMAILVPSGLVLMMLFGRDEEGLSSVSGILLIGETFLLLFLTGTIPMAVSGMPLLDAFFESVSGFTTTGFTMVRDFDSFPNSLFLWRSMTQWIGGISVILIFLYMLPAMGLGGKGLFLNETSGANSKNFSVRLRDATKSFLIIYFILTMVQMILLLMFGVAPLESACMTLSTVSTGGFLPDGSSVMNYGYEVKIIDIIFMFLGGTNFYLHYKGIYRGRFEPYKKSVEFRWILYWFTGISILLTILILNAKKTFGTEEIFSTFLDTAFTVVSLGTSTGFAVVDYTDAAVWPVPIAFALLLLVCFVGGMGGSTAGGVKMYRFVIILKYIKNNIYKTLHPLAVYDVKMDDQSVDESSVMYAFVIVSIFSITILVFSLVLMLNGMEAKDSVGLIVSTTVNTGAAFGNYGPFDDLYCIDPLTKIIMCVLMFLGRIEMATGLLLFMPGFWKEVMMNRGKKTRRVREFNISMLLRKK